MLAGLGHHSKFQRVSRLGFVTAATKLCVMFSCLLGWYTIYTFSKAFAPWRNCHVQNSVCVQVLRSAILTALLHGTRPLGVSQTFRRGTRNVITELLQRAPPIFGWAAITLGIGPHFSLLFYRQDCPQSQTPVLLQLDRIF